MIHGDFKFKTNKPGHHWSTLWAAAPSTEHGTLVRGRRLRIPSWLSGELVQLIGSIHVLLRRNKRRCNWLLWCVATWKSHIHHVAEAPGRDWLLTTHSGHCWLTAPPRQCRYNPERERAYSDPSLWFQSVLKRTKKWRMKGFLKSVTDISRLLNLRYWNETNALC